MRNSRLILTALVAVGALALTGCFSGPRATTSVQATQPTGNGAQAQVGQMRIENATVVTGAPGTATLLTRIVNQGTESDVLLGVQIEGVPAYITGGSVEMLPGASVSFGYNSDLWINDYSFDAEPSSFVEVAVQFEKAGIATLQALTVPPAGFYEGIAPNPATAP